MQTDVISDVSSITPNAVNEYRGILPTRPLGTLWLRLKIWARIGLATRHLAPT